MTDAFTVALPPCNIILIGFMGTGKSSIGRQAARLLKYRFQDTDRLIVEEAGMEIAGIFKLEGEEKFRNRESAALESLRGQTECVIATGGGIVTRPSNIPLLRELGFVVWLTATEEVIFERVSRNKKRPLLHTPDPQATIHSLLSQRLELYEKAAHCTLDTTTLTQAQLVQILIREAERFFSCPTPP